MRTGAAVAVVALSAAAGPAPAQSTRPQAAGLEAPVAPVDRKALLVGARSWGYQLQGLDAVELAKSSYDVMVIGFAGGDGGGLTAKEIAQIKRKPDGSRRLVLADMNIGEANSSRHYWRRAWDKAPPAWMGAASCRSKGSHHVRYWAPEWQAMVFGKPGSTLDRIIKAGFDGVYLDRVDSFHNWRGERWQGATDMIDLIVRLSESAKAREPGFLVLTHNGEDLLVDGRYRAAIDGVGKRDMLFGDTGDDTPNHPDRIKRAERNFAARGAEALPVLAMEHAHVTANVEAARRRHAELGFVSYFGPRSLASLGFAGKPHTQGRDAGATVSKEPREGCQPFVSGDW